MFYLYAHVTRRAQNTHNIISKNRATFKAASAKILFIQFCKFSGVIGLGLVALLTLPPLRFCKTMLCFFTMTRFIFLSTTAWTCIITTDFRCLTYWHFFRFRSTLFFRVHCLPFCYFFTFDVATNFCF